MPLKAAAIHTKNSSNILPLIFQTTTTHNSFPSSPSMNPTKPRTKQIKVPDAIPDTRTNSPRTKPSKPKTGAACNKSIDARNNELHVLRDQLNGLWEQYERSRYCLNGISRLEKVNEMEAKVRQKEEELRGLVMDRNGFREWLRMDWRSGFTYETYWCNLLRRRGFVKEEVKWTKYRSCWWEWLSYTIIDLRRVQSEKLQTYLRSDMELQLWRNISTNSQDITHTRQ